MSMTDSNFALKCPHCLALNPQLNCRGLRWPNGLAGAVFSCVKCHKILSISVVPASELQNQAILRPTVKEVESLS